VVNFTHLADAVSEDCPDKNPCSAPAGRSMGS